MNFDFFYLNCFSTVKCQVCLKYGKAKKQEVNVSFVSSVLLVCPLSIWGSDFYFFFNSSLKSPGCI